VAIEVLEALHGQGQFAVRSGKGGRVHQGAEDVLALIDVHQSNRDGVPFLHVHAVVMNFGRRPDGKTVSLNDREMFLAAGEAGCLFRAGVARALEQRGLAVERVEGKGRERAASFRVAGVAPELEKAFGTRKARMVEYVERKDGAVSDNPVVRARQMQEAAQNTRGSKAKVPVGEALEERWREQMKARGYTPGRVWQEARDAALTHERPALSSAEAVAVEAEAAGEKLPERVARFRVAEAEQYRGGGVAGALREAQRLLRDGVVRVAHEVRRRLGQARDIARGIGTWMRDKAPRRDRGIGRER
jgi:TrwC relaxase